MTTAPITKTARPARPAAWSRPVWQVGVLASVAGAIVTEAFGLGARAIGVSMDVSTSAGTEPAPIPVFGFAIATLMWSVVGTVLAVALAKWAKNPARTFVVTTVVLTVLSLAGPAMTVNTALATQITLAISHLVAAAVVIPLLARRLTQTRGTKDQDAKAV